MDINGVEIQGTERILNNLSHIFSPSSFSIFSPIIVACFTYQMCYLFRKKFWVMFTCSFIPCLFILLIGIHGALFGAKFLGDTLYYGLEGLNTGLFGGVIYYFIYPIIPICMIFQIICLIINYKNKQKMTS